VVSDATDAADAAISQIINDLAAVVAAEVAAV